MIFEPLLTDEAVLDEIGRRMTEARLARRMTQAQLARSAGVSKRTVERLEDGASTQLTNLVRCLRALGKLEQLDRLLPETPANPVDLLQRHGAARARGPRKSGEAGAWTWGDEP
jgi:transcriptional regulator with XRE-family HTH domain